MNQKSFRRRFELGAHGGGGTSWTSQRCAPSYRGTSLIRNTPLLGPYSRTSTPLLGPYSRLKPWPEFGLDWLICSNSLDIGGGDSARQSTSNTVDETARGGQRICIASRQNENARFLPFRIVRYWSHCLGEVADPLDARREPFALEGWIRKILYCDQNGKRAFLRILSTERRGIRLCWEHPKPKGPKDVKKETGEICTGKPASIPTDHEKENRNFWVLLAPFFTSSAGDSNTPAQSRKGPPRGRLLCPPHCLQPFHQPSRSDQID